MQVTAYGSAPARCKAADWSSGTSGTSVNVRCFDSAGAAADEMFTLAYTIDEPLGLFASEFFGDTGAYVWADKARATGLYTPSRKYNYNGFKTGELTAQKNSTGIYTVTLSGVESFDAAAVLVTANGDSNDACTAGSGGQNWMPIVIYCYDGKGNPADSRFSVLLQTDVKE